MVFPTRCELVTPGGDNGGLGAARWGCKSPTVAGLHHSETRPRPHAEKKAADPNTPTPTQTHQHSQSTIQCPDAGHDPSTTALWHREGQMCAHPSHCSAWCPHRQAGACQGLTAAAIAAGSSCGTCWSNQEPTGVQDLGAGSSHWRASVGNRHPTGTSVQCGLDRHRVN